MNTKSKSFASIQEIDEVEIYDPTDDKFDDITSSVNDGLCSPEEYIRSKYPNQEMMEVWDEVEGKWLKMPDWEPEDEKNNDDKTLVEKANTPAMTAGVIISCIAVVALITFICF